MYGDKDWWLQISVDKIKYSLIMQTNIDYDKEKIVFKDWQGKIIIEKQLKDKLYPFWGAHRDTIINVNEQEILVRRHYWGSGRINEQISIFVATPVIEKIWNECVILPPINDIRKNTEMTVDNERKELIFKT